MAKKITELNNMTIDAARAAIEAKFAEIKEEIGISLKLGCMNYNEESFTATLEGAPEVAGDEYEREYNKHVRYGLVPEGLIGKEFKVGPSTFTFRGIKPRARTKTFRAEGADKNLYKFDKADVLKRLGITEDLKPQRV